MFLIQLFLNIFNSFVYESITLPAHISAIYFSKWSGQYGIKSFITFWLEYDLKIILVSKCFLDIEQYVELKMSVFVISLKEPH